MKLVSKIFIIYSLFLISFNALGQKKIIYGQVFDSRSLYPLKNVSVEGNAGLLKLTDSNGFYEIFINYGDSIWFSYNGKNSEKFSTKSIYDGNLNIMLHLQISNLPEVTVFNRNYHLDSLLNRKEYSKYFNYEPGLKIGTTNNTLGQIGAGIDLESLVNLFRTRYNRHMEALQNRLIDDEQNKYVDHRFNRVLVKKITHLQEPDLSKFMAEYRPQYNLVTNFNDLELAVYIQESFYEFMRQRHY
ncbi:MAG: hypothetical protein ORN85_10665 [Sediminibacterium sp.]|nr:hypothetical protein [Sediminibacterium sp.]